MKSIYDTSTCVNCSQKIAKGVEIEKNADEKWVHSVCPNGSSPAPKQESPQITQSKGRDTEIDDFDDSKESPDLYKDCILGCVRAAEFFKSIDYPKELWNLSTIWNTERIKKK